MKRSKKIVLVSHCILNCNSKVEGLSVYCGANSEVVLELIKRGYGIIQLPCPEMMYGIKRWGHVKEQFDTPYFRDNSRRIFEPVLKELIDYINNGYKICGIVGIDGSPSCGVDLTCSSSMWGGEIGNGYNLDGKIKDLKMVKGEGVFIQEIKKMLQEKGIDIPITAVNEEAEKGDIDKIIKVLEK